jgi:hypothetical protein
MLEDGVVVEDGVKVARGFSSEAPTTSFCASSCSDSEVVVVVVEDDEAVKTSAATTTSTTTNVLPIIGAVVGIVALTICMCFFFRLKSNLQTRKSAEVQFSNVSANI